MLNSVRIGEKDLYTDFDCILAHVSISAPTVRSKFVDVPLRNGKLDLTELLTDDVRYEDRDIKIDLKYIGESVMHKQSEIANYLHGQRMQINFDEDESYFYIGRFTGFTYDVTNYGGKIHLTGTCDPFKYTLISSLDDWLWDPFDFEEGYINELSNIVVNGSKTITLIADEKISYATIISDSQMDVTYDNVTVRVGVGTTTLYDFEFKQGDNVITLTGNGTVSIDYRGARL